MDYELLVALWVLWVSSTLCLCACAFMWLMNEGQAFHPHSVDIEWRHDFYQVVKSNTACKTDFAVKSVSEFIAARQCTLGSSSEKYLTVLIVIGGVAGFLGTSRWYAVGDASHLEAVLSHIGFFSLLIIAVFEVDVSSESFLEQKVLITSWFLQLLDTEKHLKFSPHMGNPQLLEFLRGAKALRHLFEEDDGSYKFDTSLINFKKIQFSLHVIGAMSYSVFVTAAIILNEINEEKVAWITGVSFVLFSALGYLSGAYVPMIPFFRGWVLLWNPFMREPEFLEKLQQAVNEYAIMNSSRGTNDVSNLTERVLRNTPRKRNTAKIAVIGPLSDSEIKNKAKDLLDRFYFIRLAYESPKNYLRGLSHVYMTVELVALMTPMIAMGIQWLTALCPGPPLQFLWPMFSIVGQCLLNVDLNCEGLQSSCIVA